AHLVHAVEDPAMDRLQSVPDVRQSSSNDHAHRVIHVGRAHLVLDGDLGQAFINRHSSLRASFVTSHSSFVKAMGYRLVARGNVSPYRPLPRASRLQSTIDE